MPNESGNSGTGTGGHSSGGNSARASLASSGSVGPQGGHSKRLTRLYRSRSNTDSELGHILEGRVDSCLEPPFRPRLYELFGLIEKEFENLFAENLALQAKVEVLTERLAEGGGLPPETTADFLNISASDVAVGAKVTSKKSSQVGQKLKTALRVPPGRLVSSFKAGVGVGGDASRARFVRHFDGHKDGIWDVATSRGPRCVVGSASADQTARLWCAENGKCLAQYLGHGGSVNGISFSPTPTSLSDLTIVTAGGDQAAHIWKANLSNAFTTSVSNSGAHHSSEDELEMSEKEETVPDEAEQIISIRTPLLELTGHTGVVISADWLCGGDQVLTASWDRTAHIYDAEKGEILNILSGHDQELTFCDAHWSQKLVVTSSKDTTFRLWDFREPIHSVAVFQGHTESVTSAVFSNGDKVVSGSDDRTVKIWDLKNMRSSLATLRLDSPINRLAVSVANNVIAIPHDNRHVRLYDLNGTRIARLPRTNRRCHRRMVCAAAWGENPGSSSHSNLFTAGFDKQLIGWKTSLSTLKDS